ncbi:MAG: aspartate aminotransferase family protein [bacterium]|nr:aspartate aminotransferase family protein [bacterium]
MLSEETIRSDGSGQNSDWLDRFRRCSPKCSQREHDPSFGTVFVRGQGATLIDVEGHSWMDLTCGFSATNFGHCYPPLVETATRQLQQLTHMTGEPHVGRIRLAERLRELISPEIAANGKVIFNSSGARAVETAWKAVSSFRPGRLVVLDPSLHGRTIATSAISHTTQTQLSETLSGQVMVRPWKEYPYCAYCPIDAQYPTCQVACAEGLFRVLEESPQRVSAVLVEPALTARGYIFPPESFFQQLRSVTRRHGILLVADEIQTGLGRCGHFLLSKAQGWQADLVLLGKSLGGGIVPMAAVFGRADVLDAIPAGAESETAAANPLACAIAERVVELLNEGQIYKLGRRAGEFLRTVMREALSKTGLANTVEGQAASCAVEFLHPGIEPSLASSRARGLTEACIEQRVRVHWTGPLNTRVVLLPPLTITENELQEASRRLRAAAQSCVK